MDRRNDLEPQARGLVLVLALVVSVITVIVGTGAHGWTEKALGLVVGAAGLVVNLLVRRVLWPVRTVWILLVLDVVLSFATMVALAPGR